MTNWSARCAFRHRDERSALSLGPSAIGFAQFGLDPREFGIIDTDSSGLLRNLLSEHHHLPGSIVVEGIQSDDVAKERIVRTRRCHNLREFADRRVQLPVRDEQDEGTQGHQRWRRTLPPIFAGFRTAEVEPGVTSDEGRELESQLITRLERRWVKHLLARIACNQVLRSRFSIAKTPARHVIEKWPKLLGECMICRLLPVEARKLRLHRVEDPSWVDRVT